MRHSDRGRELVLVLFLLLGRDNPSLNAGGRDQCKQQPLKGHASQLLQLPVQPLLVLLLVAVLAVIPVAVLAAVFTHERYLQLSVVHEY